MRVLHDKWVSVTTARLVLRLRMNGRSPNMERGCEYVEYVVADRRRVVVLHLGCWAMCWQLLTLKMTILWTIHDCLRLGLIPWCKLSNGKGTRVGTVGGYLWMRSWTFELHKMRGISWLAENLLASEEEFFYMTFLNDARNTHVATCIAVENVSWMLLSGGGETRTSVRAWRWRFLALVITHHAEYMGVLFVY